VASSLRPNLEIIDRCNLTVLQEPGQEDLVEFLKANRVHIIASLPCYSAENVDTQNGNGVFGWSIAALIALMLNDAGYGRQQGCHWIWSTIIGNSKCTTRTGWKRILVFSLISFLPSPACPLSNLLTFYIDMANWRSTWICLSGISTLILSHSPCVWIQSALVGTEEYMIASLISNWDMLWVWIVFTEVERQSLIDSLSVLMDARI
jgi:hypothetical protein